MSQRLCVIAFILGLAACEAAGGSVSRADFERENKIWPLTVERARVGCDGLDKWVEVDGVRYGINGYARQHGLPGMEPVWRVDEEAEAMLRSAGDNNLFKPRVSDLALNQAAEVYCKD